MNQASRHSIAQLPPAFVTFSLTLIVYAVTLAPGLTSAHFGGDGGELITAAATLGVPHPQGYPTYTLLGKLISLIPIGTAALRFNFFSAFCIAAAAAVLTQTAHEHSLNDIAAVGIGLTFAFTRLVWSQALITEVYGLNLLVLAVLLWACQRQVAPVWLGALWGLALTTHLTSLLMLPLVLWATEGKQLDRFAGGVALGLLPFATLPLLARGDSVVVWSDPTTLQGWWWLVSGRIYRPNVFSHPLLPRLADHALVILRQFASVGWVIIGYGIWRGQFRPKTILPFGTALAYTLYAFSYDTPDFAVFALPAVLLLAPYLAAGYQRLPMLGVAVPLALLILNFGAVNLRNDTTTHDQAIQLLTSVPEQTILMTPGDESIFTLWYLQQVEIVRPDVILVDQNLFAFDWYRARLGRLYPSLQAVAVDDLDAFERHNLKFRPICSASIHSYSAPRCVGPIQQESSDAAKAKSY